MLEGSCLTSKVSHERHPHFFTVLTAWSPLKEALQIFLTKIQIPVTL